MKFLVATLFVGIMFIAEMHCSVPGNLSPTPSRCVTGWTDYFNTDSPNTGGSDYESVHDIVKEYNVCPGGIINNIECKALVDGVLVNRDKTGDFLVSCVVGGEHAGSYCSNRQQKGRRLCHDYQIRLYCTCPNTTSTNTVEVRSTKRCAENEYYTTCGGCDGDCNQPVVPCPRICHPPGCYCTDDTVRGPDGNCIPLSKCSPSE